MSMDGNGVTAGLVAPVLGLSPLPQAQSMTTAARVSPNGRIGESTSRLAAPQLCSSAAVHRCMGLDRSRAAATIGLVACLLAATTASAATTTTVRSRAGLTTRETLRGTMTFKTPAAWRATPKSGVYTAYFSVDAGPQCTVEISAYIGAKATRRTAKQQVVRSPGANPAASGRRAGGFYSVGRAEPSPAATSWLHGVAVIRVARRRFASLRMFTSFSGADCSAAAAPEGAITKSVASVLHDAQARLHVAR